MHRGKSETHHRTFKLYKQIPYGTFELGKVLLVALRLLQVVRLPVLLVGRAVVQGLPGVEPQPVFVVGLGGHRHIKSLLTLVDFFRSVTNGTVTRFGFSECFVSWSQLRKTGAQIRGQTRAALRGTVNGWISRSVAFLRRVPLK